MLNKTGEDPLCHTFVWFEQVLARLHKLRRYEPGGGVTREELFAERMAEKMKAKQDD